MTELEKLTAAKDLLISTQKRLITAQDIKIATLEDQLAAANTVIAECREFMNNLKEKEERLNH